MKIYLYFTYLIEKLIFYLIKKKFYITSLVLSRTLSLIFLRKFIVNKNYSSVEELLAKVKSINFNKKHTIKKPLKFKKNIKILFLIPNSGGGDVENIFVDTAKNYRMKTDIFYTENISYKNLEEENSLNLNIAKKQIIKKIEILKPNLIFMDCNFMGNRNTIDKHFIKLIKKKYKLKVVGFIGDFYSTGALQISKYWSNAINCIFHLEPCYKNFIANKKIPRNMFFLPYFLNDKDFKYQKKKYDIFFSGIGNVVRLPYLIFVNYIEKELFNKKKIFFHNIDKYKKNELSVSRKKYKDYLTSSKIVLNLSARKARGVRILTGRSIQAIASKSLALDEENKSMKVLYTPFRHYIPFNSIKELSIALRFIKEYPKLVDCIIEESFTYYCNNYRSDFGWKKILNFCNLQN